MRFKAFRRLCFRLAFKGCKVDHPDAAAYVAAVTSSTTRENRIRIERALELEYWARELAK